MSDPPVSSEEPDATIPRDGQQYLVVTDLVTFRLIGADTNGAYSIFETLVQPHARTPRLHAHPHQETIYVLDGDCLISMMPNRALRTVHVGPGAIVHSPGGVPHGFQSAGDIPARILAVVAPAGLERFFAELGIPMDGALATEQLQSPPDREQVVAVMARHGVALVAPPDDCCE